MKELLAFLDKYRVKYTVEGDEVIVSGNLYLYNNQLTALPESFGNLKVGGDLWLHNNQLTALPESFGNLKVGGDLSLSNNQLTSEPVFNRMAGNVVAKDWCYVDGIVREVVSRKNLGEGLTLIKTPFDFIVGNGEAWAHCKTTEEALEDYRFKLYKSDPEELKGLDIDKPLSHPEAINVYRAITGACREGVRQWMNGRQLPEPITIRQVLSLTGEAYGGSEFAGFFGGKTV